MFKTDFSKGAKMNISVTLLGCGSGLAPASWRTDNLPRPYRLYYIKGGTAFYQLGTKEYPMKKDHFYLFPSSLPFFSRQEPEDRLDHVYYDFIMTPPIISQEPVVCSLEEHPLFPSFLSIMQQTILDSLQQPTPEKKDIAAAVLEAFLTLFCSVKPAAGSFDSDILSSIAYIETHYSEPITVSDMAAGLFLNTDYFIRKFKNTVGITPYVYLTRLRLSIAVRLLKNGMSLQDTAAATGFQYTSSLCHAMKKNGL